MIKSETHSAKHKKLDKEIDNLWKLFEKTWERLVKLEQFVARSTVHDSQLSKTKIRDYNQIVLDGKKGLKG